MTLGGFGPLATGRPARDLFGQRPGFVARSENIAAVAQLRQNRQVGAARGRLLDHLETARYVPLLLADMGLHLNAGNANLALRLMLTRGHDRTSA